jgi:DNA (cytosine-5)-methyltransferase 1
MNYLSVCSGIEAATVAWRDLPLTPIAYSEIEAFPCSVLMHRHPDVKNYGDMTRHKEWDLGHTVDLLVGGTPCQSFSVAGLRRGMDDPRGNLALVYLSIIDQFRPRWIVWENVPGVLTSKRGNDFASFVSGLAILGYGWAYRVFDAQYFGLAQRRKRVFVIGYLGDWRPPAAVLFEPESMRRNTSPSRSQRAEAKSDTTKSVGSCVKEWPASVSCTLTAEIGYKRGAQYQHINAGCPLFVPVTSELAGTLRTRRPGEGGHETDATHIVPEISPPLTSGQRLNSPDKEAYIHAPSSVRRLTPVECERLQGFPDDYTKVPHAGRPAAQCPDNPRYKAIGNSMAVPVMRWIGRRLCLANRMLINKI